AGDPGRPARPGQQRRRGLGPVDAAGLFRRQRRAAGGARMILDADTRRRLIRAVAEQVIGHADELTALDQAIGDGDHGVNMKRGLEGGLADLDGLAAKPLPEALKGVGTALVMKVGGASGPLYGSLFLGLGKALAEDVTRDGAADAFAQAVAAVKARG